MRENTDQKNSVFEHFSRSVHYDQCFMSKLLKFSHIHRLLLRKVLLKLTSHGILHCLWSANLSICLSQLIVSIFTFSINSFCQYLSSLNIYKCGVTPHCLYRDSLTLIEQIIILPIQVKPKYITVVFILEIFK